MAAAAVKGKTMAHYYAVAERAAEGGWFLTFPGGAGYSFAETPEQIVAQAQDWLESVLMEPPGALPRSIEDGAKPPADLSDYDPRSFVVVIPFEPATVAKEAA
jgi:predicted RNase H-like HicB family nuclease